MKLAHCVIVRACSWLTGHIAASIIGLAAVWMTSAPNAAWGQSAVWLPQGATTGNIYYNNGYVGIGTESPQGKFDVRNGRAFVSANNEPYSLGVTYGYGTNGWWLGGTSNSALVFSTWGGAEKMRLDANGNLGIGTTAPQYKLAVNGTIGAKEVIVTNTGWPDYVLRPGYRLRPLREVGAYIQAHHRLPDIPSEAEVKQKGVSVGDMQARLLAKIEELTLHMIQADQRNSRLEQQNRELQDRIARLEARNGKP